MICVWIQAIIAIPNTSTTAHTPMKPLPKLTLISTCLLPCPTNHTPISIKNKLASFDPRRLNATTRIEPTRRSHRGLRSRQRWTSSGTAAPLRTSSGAPSAPTPRRSTTLDLTNQRRQSHHGPDRVRDRRGSRRGGAETAAWLLPPVARGVADSPAACGGVASNGYDKRRYFFMSREMRWATRFYFLSDASRPLWSWMFGGARAAPPLVIQMKTVQIHILHRNRKSRNDD